MVLLVVVLVVVVVVVVRLVVLLVVVVVVVVVVLLFLIGNLVEPGVGVPPPNPDATLTPNGLKTLDPICMPDSGSWLLLLLLNPNAGALPI